MADWTRRAGGRCNCDSCGRALVEPPLLFNGALILRVMELSILADTGRALCPGRVSGAAAWGCSGTSASGVGDGANLRGDGLEGGARRSLLSTFTFTVTGGSGAKSAGGLLEDSGLGGSSTGLLGVGLAGAVGLLGVVGFAGAIGLAGAVGLDGRLGLAATNDELGLSSAAGAGELGRCSLAERSDTDLSDTAPLAIMAMERRFIGSPAPSITFEAIAVGAGSSLGGPARYFLASSP